MCNTFVFWARISKYLLLIGQWAWRFEIDCQAQRSQRHTMFCSKTLLKASSAVYVDPICDPVNSTRLYWEFFCFVACWNYAIGWKLTNPNVGRPLVWFQLKCCSFLGGLERVFSTPCNDKKHDENVLSENGWPQPVIYIAISSKISLRKGITTPTPPHPHSRG